MTINVKAVLNTLDIDPNAGAIRAIQRIGENIVEATDPLGYANAVISSLGGQDQIDFPTARIMAKAMVEQAVTQGEAYVPEQAVQFAVEKVVKLRKTDSYIFSSTKDKELSVEQDIGPVDLDANQPKKTTQTKGKAPKSGDLKSNALAICKENSGLANGALAKMISEQLGITYANAYYYASRVFKRK